MNTKNEYLIVWEFRAKPEAQLEFEKFYGPAGDWAALFRLSPDYRGTQLVRDIDRPGRYLTLDRWTSGEAFRRFKQAHQADYDALDKQCETLTGDERLRGEFESLSAGSSGSPKPSTTVSTLLL